MATQEIRFGAGRALLGSHGARLLSFRPGFAGADGPEVLLRYQDDDEYLHDPYFLGATVGRYANRLRGPVPLEGSIFMPEATVGTVALHGGPAGFSEREWHVEQVSSSRVDFVLQSQDGDQGFPGQLLCRVIYTLESPSSLRVTWRATARQTTVVNLSNHAYFNLNGNEARIVNHEVAINSDACTTLDSEQVPTGEIASVAGTGMDLSSPAVIAERMDACASLSGGFDHNYVIRGVAGRMRHAATVRSPISGLRLDVDTTQPGLQFYTGQHLDDPFRPFAGFCLEAQNFPDAPNHGDFPSAVLRPGERYQHIVRYRLSQQE